MLIIGLVIVSNMCIHFGRFGGGGIPPKYIKYVVFKGLSPRLFFQTTWRLHVQLV